MKTLRLAMLAATMLAVPALAQQQAPAAPQVIYQLNLPASAVQVILNGVSELPGKIGTPVSNEIWQQVTAQDMKRAADEKADKAKADSEKKPEEKK